MPIPSPATPRLVMGWRTVPLVALLLVSVLAACSSVTPTNPQSSTLPTASLVATPSPTPSPTPTPAPTPLFTNPPNPTLEALIPDTVAGVKVQKPASDQFGITPGDIGLQYGDVGARFRSLAIAFIEPRKLSLYAMTVEGAPVRTTDLEPYLAKAGRYVGINGLHREPWKLSAIGDRLTWVRPEDNATAAGTMIYTWADGSHVFLMIGTDDRLNRAMLAALPGETPPPSPSPSASGGPAAGGSGNPTPGDSGTPSLEPTPSAST